MKKLISIVLLSVMAVSLFSACGYKEPPAIGFLVADQFDGYKLGTVEELVPGKEIKDLIGDPDIVKFSSAEKGLSALRNKKVHGMVLPAVYAHHELEKTDDFMPTEITFIEKQLRAISLNTQEFIIHIDTAFTAILNNGTAQKIADAHSPYANPEDPYVRPSDYKKIDGRVITVGICSDDNYPLNYRNDAGELVGINVDIAYEMAAGARADLVIKEYPADKLMEALDAGEVDFILNEYFEDENNPISTKYLYSHNYCDASTYILIRSPMADFEDKQN